jgi:hypothetical protein
MSNRTLALRTLVAVFLMSSIARAMEEGYRSPQEVYHAAQQKYQQRDFAGVSSCFTCDSMRTWSAVALINAFVFVEKLEKRGEETLADRQAIESILSAHGTSMTRFGKVAWKSYFAFTKKQTSKFIDEVVRDIKDHPRFFHDMMTELAKHDQNQDKFEPMIYEFLAFEFSELELKQDRAVAKVQVLHGDKSTKKHVAFHKTEKGWLISCSE